MKQYLLKISVVATFIFATSCATTKYLAIDILQPAAISLDETVVNIAVVDNAGAVITNTENDVSIPPMDVVTSNVKTVFLEALTQFMNDEKYFHEVKLQPNAMRTDTNYGRQVPMSKSTIQSLASTMDVDAIVAIEHFETGLGETMVNLDGWLFTAAQAHATLMFRLFNANGDAITPYMATSDSITWAGDPNTIYDGTQFHQQLALQLAEITSKQLVPHWESQERIYYSNGTKLMKEADKLVQKGEWTEAAKVWGAAYEAETDNNQKSKIAANIALANENLGDIPNAAQWIRIASNDLEGNQRAEHAVYINWYKVKLLERERDNSKVLEQMGLEEVVEEE